MAHTWTIMITRDCYYPAEIRSHKVSWRSSNWKPTAEGWYEQATCRMHLWREPNRITENPTTAGSSIELAFAKLNLASNVNPRTTALKQNRRIVFRIGQRGKDNVECNYDFFEDSWSSIKTSWNEENRMNFFSEDDNEFNFFRSIETPVEIVKNESITAIRVI